MYTCMQLTTSDGRFAMANFFQPSQFSVDIHLNSLVIRFFGSQSEKIAVAHQTSDVTNRNKPNINEKGEKSRYRKSAIGCRKPHPCVRRLKLHVQFYNKMLRL